MRKKTIWNDVINGFTVELVNWSFSGEAPFDKWNYYIYFTEKNTPAKFWDKLIAIAPGEYTIDYYNSVLTDFDWHGGITFAEFMHDSMQEIKSIKAGCDYSHLCDEGYEYSLDDILADVKVTIKSIEEVFS